METHYTDITGENQRNFSNTIEAEKSTLSEDMLTLYDDIINDIFGKNEKDSDLAGHRQDYQDKDIDLDQFKESNSLWSPYSYNSFLSELYTVSSSNEQLHV